MKAARDRLLARLSALTILLLLVAALGFGVVVPLLETFVGDDEDRVRSLQLLAGYQRVAAHRSTLESRLAALKREETALPGLWPGGTAALAAAGLEAEVKQLIESAGGQIRGSQQVTSDSEGGYDRIGRRFDLTLPMAALPRLLRALDAHTPYLFLDQIDLHVLQPQAKAVPVLTMHCQIIGYHAGQAT